MLPEIPPLLYPVQPPDPAGRPDHRRPSSGERFGLPVHHGFPLRRTRAAPVGEGFKPAPFHLRPGPRSSPGTLCTRGDSRQVCSAKNFSPLRLTIATRGEPGLVRPRSESRRPLSGKIPNASSQRLSPRLSAAPPLSTPASRRWEFPSQGPFLRAPATDVCTRRLLLAASLPHNGCPWACSSAGRASALQAGGRRFEPGHVHHSFQ
jgi:hypothetical protein